MNKIENVLGLKIINDFLADKYDTKYFEALSSCAKDMMSLQRNQDNPDREQAKNKIFDRLLEIYDEWDNEKFDDYRIALRQLVNYNAEYLRCFKKMKRNPQFEFSVPLRNKIKLACWILMGNKIPNRMLIEKKLKNFLRRRGMTYKKAKNESGWYKDGKFIACNKYQALEYLEQFEKVDRKRLTIKF